MPPLIFWNNGKLGTTIADSQCIYGKMAHALLTAKASLFTQALMAQDAALTTRSIALVKRPSPSNSYPPYDESHDGPLPYLLSKEKIEKLRKN